MKQGQRPGKACEECRRRKLKCNGAEPQCSVCADSGIECVVIREREARGPKKGYLKVLRDRIADLECQLRENQLPAQTLSNCLNNFSTNKVILDQTAPAPPAVAIDDASISSPLSCSWEKLMPGGLPDDPGVYSSLTNPSEAFSKDFLSVTTNLSLPNLAMSAAALSYSDINSPISEIMKAELNQIFFDRVHPFVPILQQRYYLRRIKQKETMNDSQACLQYSMWALASLMSVHLQHLHEAFYLDTKHMLSNLDLLPNMIDDQTETEIAQAWLLMAIFESMKANHRQAWSSAGRAFRLVQLMRLHKLDVGEKDEENLSENQFVAKEERRRVLWMAFLLDHLFCMRNNWPITLGEGAIQTRLPTSEEDFQSCKRSVGNFLSDVIGETCSTEPSTFNECLVLVSLCERSLLYSQPNGTTIPSVPTMPDGSNQYLKLEKILDSRLQMLSESYASPSQVYDPMLLFANIMSQATILYVSRRMIGSDSQPMGVSQTDIDTERQQRAIAAADNMVDLAKTLLDFHIFKTHPLTPIPLFVSIEFLYTNRFMHEKFNTQLQELRGVFQELKSINNPSQSYIDLLGLSCTPTAIEMMAS